MLLAKRAVKEEGIGLRMAPMIDIVFLLLIFFMCVSEVSRQEADPLTLPRALEGREGAGPGPLTVVNVLRDGTCRVSGRTLSAAELDELLGRRAAAAGGEGGRSELAVKIRADAAAPYGHVLRVMADCRRAGIWKISFGVAPDEGR